MSEALRLPSLDAIRAFEAVARLGTAERAADELHITASAVSKRIASLESALGAELLLRAGRTLALTPTGKDYLEHIRSALALLANVPLHQRVAQRVERVRLCAPPTFSRQILIPALERFNDGHPGIELELVLSIPFLDTAPPRADVTVHSGPPRGAEAEALLDEPLWAAASPTYLQHAGPFTRPEDLARAILVRCPIEPWQPWFRAAGLDWPEPAQGPRLLDLGLAMEAGVRGQGVVLVRPSLAREWLRTGALVRLFDVDAGPVTQYWVECEAESRDRPAARAVLAWVREACRAAQTDPA